MKYKQRPTMKQREELYKMIKDFAIKNDYKLTITKTNKMKTNNENLKGVLFKNDNKKTDNHPDYNGKIVIDNIEFYLSAWVNTSKDNTKYMSLSIGKQIETKEQPKEVKPMVKTDDLPF